MKGKNKLVERKNYKRPKVEVEKENTNHVLIVTRRDGHQINDSINLVSNEELARNLDMLKKCVKFADSG